MGYNGLLDGHDYLYDLNWLVRMVKRHSRELAEIDKKIEDAVKLNLSDERIKAIVTDIISNASGVINVRIPPNELTPATGNGTANDTTAIQGCIDYAAAQGGGIVYFPNGKYLTNSLTLKDNVGLLGQGRYSTVLVGAMGSNNYVIGGNASRVSVADLGINGNQSNQVNDIDGVQLTGDDYLLTNLEIKNVYSGINVMLTDEHFQADNIVVDGCAHDGITVLGGQHIQIAESQVINVSSTTGQYGVEIAGDYAVLSDMIIDSVIPVGLVLNASNSVFNGFITGPTVPYNGTGNNNQIDVYGIEKLSVYEHNVTENISGTRRINTNDLVFNPTNPITYRTPTTTDNFYDTIPFQDPEGNQYNVMVEKTKLSIGFNVKDYGALGDGVTDDTDAIQACMDAAMEIGGYTVIFPPGEYSISKTLLIRPHTASSQDDSNQKVHFNKMDKLSLLGEGECILKASQTMDYMLQTYDFSYPENIGSFSNFYTQIKNIKFDGNNMASTALYLDHALHSLINFNRFHNIAVAIHIRGYGEMDVRNNVIKVSKTGILAESAGDSLYEKNDIYLENAAVGIALTGFSGSAVINKNTFTPIHVDTPSSNNNTVGISLYNSDWSGAPATTGAVKISNNSFDGTLWGVKAYSDPPYYVTDIELWGNKIANNYNFTGVSLFQGVNVDNCMIHDNNFGVQARYLGAANMLAELTNCSRCVIDGNLITPSNGTPIILYSCSKCSVINNTILGYSGEAGILISGTSNNVNVINNIIDQEVSASASTPAISEKDTADYNRCENNLFSNAVLTPYKKVGILTVMNRKVYAYEIPTTGSFLVGDIVINLTANSDIYGWVCVENGSPGTWKAISI